MASPVMGPTCANVYKPERLKEAGFAYYGVERPTRLP